VVEATASPVAVCFANVRKGSWPALSLFVRRNNPVEVVPFVMVLVVSFGIKELPSLRSVDARLATLEAIESTSTCDAFEPTTAVLAFVATVAVSESKSACEAFVPTVVVSAVRSALATLFVLTNLPEPSTPTARVTVSFTGRFAIMVVDSNDTGLCIDNGLPLPPR
jgi:hypothetical protein